MWRKPSINLVGEPNQQKWWIKTVRQLKNPAETIVNPGDTVNYVDGKATTANVVVTQGSDGKEIWSMCLMISMLMVKRLKLLM